MGLISMWDVKRGDAIIPGKCLWGRAEMVVVLGSYTERQKNRRVVLVIDVAGRKTKWTMPAYFSTGERTRHLLPEPYDTGTLLTGHVCCEVEDT